MITMLGDYDTQEHRGHEPKVIGGRVARALQATGSVHISGVVAHVTRSFEHLHRHARDIHFYFLAL